MIVIDHEDRKEKYTLNERKKQVTGVEEGWLSSNDQSTDKDDNGKWNQHEIYIENIMVKTEVEINTVVD